MIGIHSLAIISSLLDSYTRRRVREHAANEPFHPITDIGNTEF